MPVLLQGELGRWDARLWHPVWMGLWFSLFLCYCRGPSCSSPPLGAPSPSPGTTWEILGEINDFVKLHMLVEPISGMQKRQSGPGAGMVMARDGGMKPIGTQGTHSAPHRRWEMLGTPPNSLPPLGGGGSQTLGFTR